MSKKHVVSMGVVGVLSALFLLAGCTSTSGYPEMPKNHEGRFEVIGADGCYGCHGAGDNGKTKSETAPGLPAGHYQDHSRESQTIDSGHMTCTNCHAVESDEAESNS